MSKEQFPTKKPGDSLSADHVNKLSSVAGRFARREGGTNQLTLHGASKFSSANLFPWSQYLVIVSNKKINATDDEDSGLYLVKIRWYSNDDSEWKTNDDKEYELDAVELSGALEVDDKIVAFWDQQRSMFVPIESGDTGRYFELSDDLAPGGTATAFPRDWNGTEYVTDVDGDTFEVVDVLERFRGRGRNYTDESNELDGSIGLAIARNGQWEIEHLQPHALFIVCLADGAFTGDPTVPVPVTSVDVVLPVNTALLMRDPVVNVLNPFSWDGPDNARIVAMWNDDIEDFEMLQVDC